MIIITDGGRIGKRKTVNERESEREKMDKGPKLSWVMSMWPCSPLCFPLQDDGGGGVAAKPDASRSSASLPSGGGGGGLMGEMSAILARRLESCSLTLTLY